MDRPITSGRTNVVQFISRLEKDCSENFRSLCERAKMLKLEGFEDVNWESSLWTIARGRLVKITGKNCKATTLNFQFAPKLGGAELTGVWLEVAKALFVLRFHRGNQTATSQRFFITAIGYVAFAGSEQSQGFFQLTPEHLDYACRLITSHYSDGVGYNLHKAVHEFAGYCDANRLCKTHLGYRFTGMKRPENVGGLAHKRLDDPEASETKSSKLVEPAVFRILGQLYQRVPHDHKYRFYVLVLVLLACLGRRFSEIALLPYQKVECDNEGRFYIEYFPRKRSSGDTFTPRRRLFLPTKVVGIVRDVITELDQICAPARQTAAIMEKVKGPDLTFLADVSDDQKFNRHQLEAVGLPLKAISTAGWFSQNGYLGKEVLSSVSGVKRSQYFLTKEGITAYCEKDFSPQFIAPVHVDQCGRHYFLKDLLLLKFVGFSTTGREKRWIATFCTHSMMTTFLRSFETLAKEYTEYSMEADFTTHHFRHTLNTLLDEGGLTDLLQTEWFGRKNPRDTKAYQHTSREKRALMLREDIKKGLVQGQVAEQLKYVPAQVQDAFLKARINAVHDVGTGMCVHNFAQTPCERHLQCSADCKDYVWVKNDDGRIEELKRQYAMTLIARETAEKQAKTDKPKKSVDWIAHNDKKFKVLSQQLIDNGISDFSPYQYLEDSIHD